MHMVKTYKSSAVPTVKSAIILMRRRPLLQHLPLFQVSRLYSRSFLVVNVIFLKTYYHKGGLLMRGKQQLVTNIGYNL